MKTISNHLNGAFDVIYFSIVDVSFEVVMLSTEVQAEISIYKGNNATKLLSVLSLFL